MRPDIRKVGIFILALMPILWLSANPKIHEDIEGQYFTKIHAYVLPDESYLADAFPYGIAIDNDGQFYMSNRSLQAIVRTALPFTEYEIVRKTGLGPGEYHRPCKLWIHENSLF